jgi:signal transduction histidine kinase
VAQILDLSLGQAKSNLPVRIRGLVTCYDHGRVFFVQDETAGMFVYYTGDRLPLRQGQYVQVTGVANQGRFSPIVGSPIIQTLEAGPTIHPQSVSLARVELGGLDAQWVEFTGIIRAQAISDSRLRLDLADPPQRITVWIPNYQGYEQLPLTGSLVRVRGVVGTSVSDRGQLQGFQVFANTIADITILNAAPADPFSMTPRLVRDLNTHYVRTGALGSVRVQGVVTLNWPGRALFIEDPTGSLEVQPQAPLDDLVPGSRVDVAGFLGPVLDPLRLEDALVRKLGANVLPPLASVPAETLFHDGHSNRLVEIEADFLGRATSPSNCLVLALQDGNRLLTALLDKPRPQTALAGLEPGCRLRLTGVCRSQAGLGADPTVSLLLRSPMDVKVIRLPGSMRTPTLQALATVTILASAGLTAALWLFQRQRCRTKQVLQRQTDLEAEMRQGEQQLRRSVEERERIGRDLHDDIIQSIYAVGLGLEDCRRVVRQSPEQAEPRLVTAIATLNNTIRSVRGFIAGLEPKILNGREFKTALKSLALTSGDGPAQFQIDVDPSAANRLTSTQATQLLHIAKEAMSNSLRHAHVSGLTVSLHPVGTGTRLEIRDDGVGFDPATVGCSGHGLRNMTARAREIGADLQIISSPGQGCRILVTVPHGNPNEPD